MEEEWKDIVGYEGLYQVSNLGNVKALSYHRGGTEKLMKPRYNQRGYCLVYLCKNGKGVWKQIHRLVATAFIPNPTNLPQVNYKNEIKDDNKIENLEWCSNLYNCRYGTRGQKIGEKLKGRKLSEERVSKMRGRVFSKETRRKISEANKGRKMPDELKEKLRKISLGRKLSDETIYKMVESRKKPILQYTKDMQFIARYDSIKEAAIAIGLPDTSDASICKCLKGKLKTYKGYKWIYE